MRPSAPASRTITNSAVALVPLSVTSRIVVTPGRSVTSGATSRVLPGTALGRPEDPDQRHEDDDPPHEHRDRVVADCDDEEAQTGRVDELRHEVLPMSAEV